MWITSAGCVCLQCELKKREVEIIELGCFVDGIYFPFNANAMNYLEGSAQASDGIPLCRRRT